MTRYARALSLALAWGLLCGAGSAYAAELVNINTADAAALDTLPGIGETKALAIIEYRTSHGPFSAIEELQNVTGIGAATFADLKDLVTVDPGRADPPRTVATTTATIAPLESLPPPPASVSGLDIGTDRTLPLNVPAQFTARVRARSGAPMPDIIWSFGDGGSSAGPVATKVYRYPGRYIVSARSGEGASLLEASIVVEVVPVAAHIGAIGPDGITLVNDGTDRLDLSGWRLAAGLGSFRIPEGTMILPGTQTLFPWAVTALPVAYEARLMYPDGIIAIRYDPRPSQEIAVSATATGTSAARAQREAANDGSHMLQTVGSAVSSPAKPFASAIETETPLPATATLAAAGAALETDPSVETPSPRGGHSWYRSTWLYGALGAAVFVGGALLIL
jgi:competence ComEA-like helix-hairpin-helix protein